MIDGGKDVAKKIIEKRKIPPTPVRPRRHYRRSRAILENILVVCKEGKKKKKKTISP